MAWLNGHENGGEKRMKKENGSAPGKIPGGQSRFADYGNSQSRSAAFAEQPRLHISTAEIDHKKEEDGNAPHPNPCFF